MNLEIIALNYDIDLRADDESGWTDGGSSARNIIWLYPTTTPWIRELSFWHELGHIISSRYIVERGLNHSMSIISKEGCAWEIGLAEAAKHGRIWDHDSEEMRWARKCLASYI